MGIESRRARFAPVTSTKVRVAELPTWTASFDDRAEDEPSPTASRGHPGFAVTT
jgi:hypothetical protein